MSAAALLSDAQIAGLPRQAREAEAAAVAAMGELNKPAPPAQPTPDGPAPAPLIVLDGVTDADGSPILQDQEAPLAAAASVAPAVTPDPAPLAAVPQEAAELRAVLAEHAALLAALRADIDVIKSVPSVRVPESGDLAERLKAIGVQDSTLDYGEEFVQDLVRIAHLAIHDETFKASMREIAQSAVNDTIKSERARGALPDPVFEYRKKRAERIPEWNRLNGSADGATHADPSFVRFLETNREPFSGLTYRQCLEMANDQCDLDRVAEITQKFTGNTTTKPAGGVSTVPVAAQVMPSPRGAVSGPGEKKTYSTAQYAQVMEQRARGLINGKKATPAQLRAVEAEMDAAVRDGRVR